MPLLDHFRPPLSQQRQWRSFHTGWAENLTADLNRRLPKGYFAEPTATYGIEIDVATFSEAPTSREPQVLREVAAPYLVRPTDQEPKLEWSPPQPRYNIPFQPSDERVEVRIYNGQAGPVLVGAIELVSPANKDRPSERSTFVSKCEAYLSRGIGLLVVDIVTTRKSNLHNELLTRLRDSHSPEASIGKPEHQLQAELYTVAYRVIERHAQPNLDVWPKPLSIGADLPTMPLWLYGDICVPIALNDTYLETCTRHRIAADFATVYLPPSVE